MSIIIQDERRIKKYLLLAIFTVKKIYYKIIIYVIGSVDIQGLVANK